MSNPWAVKSGASTLKVVETGGMEDYCKFLDTLEVSPPITKPKDELIEKQEELLNIIDECQNYSIQLKCERDLLKFGEFLNRQQVDYKIGLLSNLSDYLRDIQENREILIERICEDGKGNDLMVEENMQDDFLKVTEIASENTHYYSLLRKSNNIHPQTLEITKTSLSSIVSKTSKSMENSIKIFKLLSHSDQIKSKYNL